MRTSEPGQVLRHSGPCILLFTVPKSEQFAIPAAGEYHHGVDIEDALTMWGRWCRSGRGAPATCASAEGNYRRNRIPGDTPTGWGDYLTSPVPQTATLIDPRLALAVERTMRWLPKKHRRALFLRYVHHMPDRLICRRIAIAYHALSDLFEDARCMVQNRLDIDKPMNQRIIASIRSIPAHSLSIGA